jgi:phosphinothricin acetyltransferase
VLIRHADPQRDAAACAGIYAPFVTHSPISFEERAPTPDEFARRIAQTSQTHPFLVAHNAENAESAPNPIQGFAYGSQHRERAAYRWAADVTVYVAADARRQGIGKSLYAHLLELLARQGFQTACAGITLPNDASVGLHEALGFRPVGVYRRIGFKLGAWRDVGWWTLDIGDFDDPPAPLGRPDRLGPR